MHLLVTGITGLLGKAFAKSLPKNIKITALTRHVPEELKNIANITFIECDLCKEFSFDKLPTNINMILHMAQSRHYREFPEKANDIFDINTLMTMRLLDYAQKKGIENFVYISSGSVYEPYKDSLKEDAALSPLGFYSTSKYCAERLVLAYQSNMRCVILRPFFLYGDEYDGRLVSSVAKNISEHKPIYLQGSEEGLYFTPTHVDDMSELILNCIANNTIQGIYNTASPHVISMKQLAVLLGNKLAIDPIFEYKLDLPETKIVPDLSKAQQDFMKQNFKCIENSIDKMLEQMFKQNQNDQNNT